MSRHAAARVRSAIDAFFRRFRTPEDAGKWIEARELAARGQGRDAPVVVDVRGADEFRGPLGHIAGALNVPVDDLAARLDELSSARDRSVALVCRTDKRSARAAEILRGAGFARVAVLRGGMERWNAEGLPVDRGGR